jgi:hypothetical protein
MKTAESWPYQPSADAILAAIKAAPQHYLAVRELGATPAEGGPSWPLASANIAAFRFAAGSAEGYWPNSKAFEVIASDAIYDPKQIATRQMPPGCTMLRNAMSVISFTVPRDTRILNP